jgi:hypothetical protein
MAGEANEADMETLRITLVYPAVYREDVCHLMKELIRTLGSSHRLVSSDMQWGVPLNEPPSGTPRTTSSEGQI